MDIGKAFSYVFEDPKWVQKVLIAAVIVLFSFLIIPLFILTGYSMQLVRNVKSGEQYPLPEWTNIGALLIDGLKIFVVGLIYAVPNIILSWLSGMQGIGGLFSLLSIVYSIAYSVALPAIIGAYINGGNDIGAALKFQEIIGVIQRNLSDFIIVFLLGIVASLIAAAGLIVFVIGVLFTVPYSFMISSHLWGQLLRKAEDTQPQAVVAQ